MALPSQLVPWRSATSDQNSYARIPPTSVMARVLGTAGTAESVTPPSGAKFAVFSATSNFYANCYGTAAVPAADVTDGTASELNPVAYQLTGDITALSVVSPVAGCVVTVSFYA